MLTRKALNTCIVFVGLLIAPILTKAATPLRIYMSPVGFDSRSGLTPADAVLTLNRVQAILKQSRPAVPIEIQIAPGTYVGQSVDWTFYTGLPITFTRSEGETEQPVFDGKIGGGSNTWFKLNATDGRNTYLRFHFLTIKNYTTAISFLGTRESLSGWNGENEIYGMTFNQIGSKYGMEDTASSAAIHFVNSRFNHVANSQFIRIEDKENEPRLHALYLAHYSSNNIIERNKFIVSNGDPVRVRDASNGNYFLDNVFDKVGITSFYHEWFCDSTRNDCTKSTPECPSTGNAFRRNQLYAGFQTQDIQMFEMCGADNDCGALAGPRLHTSGNVRHFGTPAQSPPTTAGCVGSY